MHRRGVMPDDGALLHQWSLRRLSRRLQLPEHRAALQERQLRALTRKRERQEDGGRRVRPRGPAFCEVSLCFSLCFDQQSAQRHSMMKVPSPAARRDKRHPNFGLISV
jgi:hypothetical protein